MPSRREIGKTEAAYFKKINAEGGINGRKINFISYDDGYSADEINLRQSCQYALRRQQWRRTRTGLHNYSGGLLRFGHFRPR
jgi:ABC-type branched-subunit amino acid transport system substrate-binding protein